MRPVSAYFDHEGINRNHFVSELPEYADIEEAYFAECQILEEYQNDCKDRAFALFAEWFWDLCG